MGLENFLKGFSKIEKSTNPVAVVGQLVAGAIPGVSEAYDATGLVSSLVTGDYLGAGMHLLGLILPGVNGEELKVGANVGSDIGAKLLEKGISRETAVLGRDIVMDIALGTATLEQGIKFVNKILGRNSKVLEKTKSELVDIFTKRDSVILSKNSLKKLNKVKERILPILGRESLTDAEESFGKAMILANSGKEKSLNVFESLVTGKCRLVSAAKTTAEEKALISSNKKLVKQAIRLSGTEMFTHDDNLELFLKLIRANSSSRSKTISKKHFADILDTLDLNYLIYYPKLLDKVGKETMAILSKDKDILFEACKSLKNGTATKDEIKTIKRILNHENEEISKDKLMSKVILSRDARLTGWRKNNNAKYSLSEDPNLKIINFMDPRTGEIISIPGKKAELHHIQTVNSTANLYLDALEEHPELLQYARNRIRSGRGFSREGLNEVLMPFSSHRGKDFGIHTANRDFEFLGSRSGKRFIITDKGLAGVLVPTGTGKFLYYTLKEDGQKALLEEGGPQKFLKLLNDTSKNTKKLFNEWFEKTPMDLNLIKATDNIPSYFLKSLGFRYYDMGGKLKYIKSLLVYNKR